LVPWVVDMPLHLYEGTTKPVPYGTYKLQVHATDFKPKCPIAEPTIVPLPAATAPITPPAIENPIGDLKELCDFVRTPYEKRFEEDGHAHSKRYRCILVFCGKNFESDWLSNQKEAEKNAALRLLTILPVRKVDDSHVNQRGSSHEMHFQASLEVPDGNGKTIRFESDWMKKKLEARRDVMQKIVKQYFGDHLVTGMQSMNLGSPAHTPASPARSPAHSPAQTPNASPFASPYSAPGGSKPFAGMNEGAFGGGREHYVYSSDDTSLRVAEYLTRWQNKHLNHIKQKIGADGLGKSTQLDSLLTVAFIHPSFTHSEELKESVKRFLGVKWASYERLEFYGDAILGFIASKMLFEASDTDGPHELTIKRQKIVREDACCSCMKKMALDKYVIHRDILQTPSAKVLCDIYEAIIGALYCALGEDAYDIILGLINQDQE